MPAIVDRKRVGAAANVRAALIIFVTALAFMAMFLSDSLRTWAYDLPENALTEQLVAAAERWHGWMEDIGAAAASAAVSSEVQALHDAQFEE